MEYPSFLIRLSKRFSQVEERLLLLQNGAACRMTWRNEGVGRGMSRTSHDATVHSCERFGVEKAANCRVIVERHLAHFELRIHADLKISISITISRGREDDVVIENHRKRDGRKLVNDRSLFLGRRSKIFEREYLENVLPGAKLRYVHPLAIDVVPVYIATIHGDPLVTVIGAFVPEITHHARRV